MRSLKTRIVPVSLKLARLFFLDLNLGKPFFFPPFFTRLKKFWYALSRSRSASCGAHFETSYIQGYSVFFSLLSSRCKSIALGLLPVFSYVSILRAKPQLKAKRAVPACWLHAVRCLLFSFSSVLYALCTSIYNSSAALRSCSTSFLFLWLRLPYNLAENTVMISSTSCANSSSKLISRSL